MEKKIDLTKYPKEPGVYLMRDDKGGVLYVGKAKDLRARLKQYFTKSGDERQMIPFLVAEIDEIDIIVLQNEKQALLLENTLIKKHQPKYNALLKDDKTFINLHINTQHPWPQVRLIRYKGAPKEKGLYFGPYPHAHAARETLDLIQRLFPLRQCSNAELKRRARPCLLYGIKRCIAPCVNLCTKEEYTSFVDHAIRFLRGQDKEILKNLHEELKKASANLEFERAASLLHTIRGVESVLASDTLIAKAAGQNIDVLAVYAQGFDAVLMQLFWREGKLIGAEHYEFSKIGGDESDLLASFILQHYKENLPKEILTSHPISFSLEEALSEICHKKIEIHFPRKGEKKQLVAIALKNAKTSFHQKKNAQEINEKILLELEEKCDLTRYPQKIECFDTSNIAGSGHVACMVGFLDGLRDKKRTRLFHIREAQAGDDYGAMKEILMRRLTKAKEEDDLPDLIILDGGKGQLSVANAVLHELDIASVDLIALAKESARHDRGLSQERIFLSHKQKAIVLDKRSPLLFFLQRIRDEAHRMAIGFHRKSQKKSTLKSALDEIPGIGPEKRKRLLSKFGSVKRIFAASDEELLSVPGITPRELHHLRSAGRSN